MLYLNMLGLVVSAILLSTVTDVQSRYVQHAEIHSSVVHNKVTATGEEAKRRCEAEGYTYLSGSYYKVHDVPASWDNAQQICSAEGGYLTVLNDADEAQAVKELTSNTWKIRDWIWIYIGIRDREENGNWRSVLGDPLNQIYHRWAITPVKYHCGTLNFKGNLDDMVCHRSLPYVCEKQC